jgi:hypothetical protein
MKIALVFWGLTRSLKFTIKSIHTYIFNILKINNIDYDIFLHTYKLNNTYSNKRSKEFNIKLDFDEYNLLNPNYFIYDNLEEIKEKLNLKKYRTNKDPWDSNYNSVDNFILSLYSKKRITNLLLGTVSKNDFNIYQETINENNRKIEEINKKIEKYKNENYNHIINKKIEKLDLKINELNEINKKLESDSINLQEENNYDKVIFLRPDVKYLNELKLDFLNLISDNQVCIPNFCIFNNFNDRFFISNLENAKIYGNLFDELFEYSKKKELHSEQFHYDLIVKKYKLKVNLINFYFNRIRANGKEWNNDYKVRRLNQKFIDG